MSRPLQMIRIDFDSRDLWRAAKGHGMASTKVPDLGYLVHAQMAALFGELTPKPFRVHDRGHGRVEVLGYGGAEEAELREHADTFAEPVAWRSCRELATKPMPAEWRVGRRIGFEVLTCPVARMKSAGPKHRKGAEIDVFLRAVSARNGADESESPLERHQVYLDWLGAQLSGGGKLVRGELARFQLTHLYRKRQGGQRKGHTLGRPMALFRGELEVSDGDLFPELLARGIGRHRAFGFGMLMLRPC